MKKKGRITDMNLYTRDYTSLSKEEHSDWDDCKRLEKGNLNNWRIKNFYREYPRAVRHYLSLFPNNYLDPVQLTNCSELEFIVRSFSDLLDCGGTKEQDILKFINYYHEEATFIIGSILSNGYNFGNHELYVFPEFMLGNSFKVDYLIVGKSSGGYQFLFVELESLYGRITTKDGNPGQVFNKGIKQVEDWDRWLSSNFFSLRETFNKYIKTNGNLPQEFINYDNTKIHFAVVAGRRNNFLENTYWKQRTLKSSRKINLLHYDNLLDCAFDNIGKNNY